MLVYEDLVLLNDICTQLGYTTQLYREGSDRGLTIINNGNVAVYLRAGIIYNVVCGSKEFAAQLDNLLKAVKGIEEEQND